MPAKVNHELSIAALVFFLLMYSIGVQNVSAAIIDDLYDAHIAVDDQSQGTQDEAFKQALRQVLVKARGNDDLLYNQQVIKSVNRATSFVHSYSYDIEQQQLYINISFDPDKIEDLIRNAGFPVWDKRRPESIIWLAVQPTPRSDKRIMTQNEFAPVYQALKHKAERRGIRLVFPLWDLDDIQSLSVYDIWGAFSHRLSDASERYAVRSIVSARMYLSDPQDLSPSSSWVADWSLLENAQLSSGNVQGVDMLQTAEAIVDVLADNLAEKYAIDISETGQQQPKIQIVINNIDSVVYYIRALTLLENLSVVDRATLIKQQGPDATFELSLLGEVEDLKNALNLDTRIQSVVDDFGQPIADLEFFWVK